MRLTSTQRWVSIGLLLLFAFLSIEAASHDRWGWYFVAVVLLSLAYLASQLPSAAAKHDLELEEAVLYEVAVAFVGPPPLIFDRLLGEGWDLRGHGPCTAKDHDGFVALRVISGSPAGARARAAHAVQAAGAHIGAVGHPRRLA